MTRSPKRIALEVFPLDRSLGYTHHLVDMALSAGLARSFAASGRPDLTPEQWAVLSRLWEEEGVSQIELAARTGKDRHNMTRILALLEKNGFIYRRPDKGDSRRKLVHLTPAGRSLRQELIGVVEDFLQIALDGLSQADYDQYERTQRRIWENLEKMNGTKKDT